MKEGIDTMIASAVLAVILVGAFYISMETTGHATAKTDITMESFTKCIYESGATLYTSDNCVECQEQMDMFGEDFRFLKYVECKNECEREDVTKFPTWIIKGKKYEHILSLKELGNLAGCLSNGQEPPVKKVSLPTEEEISEMENQGIKLPILDISIPIN